MHSTSSASTRKKGENYSSFSIICALHCPPGCWNPLVERHSRRRPHTSSRPFSLHQTSQKCTHTGTKKMCRWPSCGRGRTIQFLALRAACKIGRGSRKCEGSLGWATYPRRQTPGVFFTKENADHKSGSRPCSSSFFARFPVFLCRFL